MLNFSWFLTWRSMLEHTKSVILYRTSFKIMLTEALEERDKNRGGNFF